MKLIFKTGIMISRISILIFSFLLLLPGGLFAQVEMADRFREDGKIYVVVATIGLILAGIFLFLIWLERRLSQLEKKTKR